MKKLPIIGLCIVYLLLSLACTSKGIEPTSSVSSTEVRDASQIDVQELDKIFLLEDYSLFETKRDSYLKTYPNSSYVQYVYLLSSKLLLKKNLLSEALTVNQEVQSKTFNANKELYFLALFESADIYEAQENYEKSLAALVESEKNKSYLPAKKRLFELPLKLSVAYARLNLTELTFRYLKETQLGLGEYLKLEALDNAALAKLYLEMGGGLSQWQSNDFDIELRKFALTYKFLVYSMNRNEAAFSEKAQKKLIAQIQWIWNLSQTQRAAPEADRIEEEKIQFLKMTELSKVLNSIKMLEPLDGQKRSLLQNELFTYVNQMHDVVLEKIYAQYKYTPPTQESFRHKIFRDQLTIDSLDNQFK
ncbi:MAG: hypothetical protein JNL11_10055 [Bdellovibrionaceae bacterium]|nr:hypothetical protein [Pseudobdellovibrionaceae bacterium]